MNTSAVNDTQAKSGTIEVLSEELEEIFKVTWMTGICCSTVGLMVQILLIVLVPNVRKVRLLILTQMTVARWLHVVIEYIINFTFAMNPVLVDTVYSVYFQVDLVMICWMSVFTSNLFYKVVIVFPTRKFYFKIACVLIWTLTIPFGIANMYDLEKKRLYYAYAVIKFVILSVNACLIIWIFILSVKSMQNVYLKTCVVAFIIVSVTSVQVLMTDIQSFLNVGGYLPMYIFSVINSFQAVIMTALFCMLANTICDRCLFQKVNTKLKQTFESFHCVGSSKRNVQS